MNKTDKKVNQYLERAIKIYNSKTSVDEKNKALAIIEIAKMIQIEEILNAKITLVDNSGDNPGEPYKIIIRR